MVWVVLDKRSYLVEGTGYESRQTSKDDLFV